MASLPPALRLAIHTWRRPVQQSFLRTALRQPQVTAKSAAWQIQHRPYSETSVDPVEPPEYLSEGEKKVFDMIKSGLEPTHLEVQDISGGCGSMYALNIVSDRFKGLPIIKQHRLVNKVLGDEMKAWHGVQLKTSAP